MPEGSRKSSRVIVIPPTQADTAPILNRGVRRDGTEHISQVISFDNRIPPLYIPAGMTPFNPVAHVELASRSPAIGSHNRMLGGYEKWCGICWRNPHELASRPVTHCNDLRRPDLPLIQRVEPISNRHVCGALLAANSVDQLFRWNAHRVEGDVLNDYQLVVILVVKPDLQQLARIFLEAGKELFVHLGDTPGRAQQSFALWILTDGFDNLLYRRLNHGLVDLLHLGGHPNVPPHALCEFRRSSSSSRVAFLRVRVSMDPGGRRRTPSSAPPGPWPPRRVPAAYWHPARSRTPPPPQYLPAGHQDATATDLECSLSVTSPRRLESPGSVAPACDASVRYPGTGACQSLGPDRPGCAPGEPLRRSAPRSAATRRPPPSPSSRVRRCLYSVASGARAGA